MTPLELLHFYAPEVAVRFVPADPKEKYYGEYDPEEGFTFTGYFLEMDLIRQKYTVLHEVAHYLTPDMRHTDAFYGKLTELIEENEIPLAIAREVEGTYPRWWEDVV